MGEKCLKQYHTYHECCLLSNIITLSQFSNFQNLVLIPHQADVSESLIRGGGKSAPQRKLAISAIFLHSMQQKWDQGTLGRQRSTLIGSRTCLGPSMDPRDSRETKVNSYWV